MKQCDRSNRQEKFPPTHFFFFFIQAFNLQGEGHSHQRAICFTQSPPPLKKHGNLPPDQPVFFRFIRFYNWYSGLLGSCLLLCLFFWFLQQKRFFFVFNFVWNESSLGWVSSLVTVNGLLYLWHTGSRACGLSCTEACGIIVPPKGMKPMSPALEDGFLTTEPPRKSWWMVLLLSF